MQLNFTTHINGKPNYFVEKILNGLIYSGFINEIKHHHLKIDLYKKTGEQNFIWGPKIHTIRKDEKQRFKPGINLHLVINPYSKTKRLQFAPLIKCTSIQKIHISFWYNTDTEEFTTPLILVDDKELNKKQMQQLAINDGFDTLEDFLTYFKGGFVGKIIHWTNFKY